MGKFFSSKRFDLVWNTQ